MGLHDKKPHHGEASSKMGSVDSSTIQSLHNHIPLNTLLGINFDRTRGREACHAQSHRVHGAVFVEIRVCQKPPVQAFPDHVGK